jgi:hypothetical protein
MGRGRGGGAKRAAYLDQRGGNGDGAGAAETGGRRLLGRAAEREREELMDSKFVYSFLGVHLLFVVRNIKKKTE